MPYINVQFIRDGATPKQKNDIIAGITRLMQEVLNKDPERTHVVIQEIETDNWGVGGKSKTEELKTKSQIKP